MVICLCVLALALHFDTRAENRWQDCCVKLGGIPAQPGRAVIQTSAMGKQHVCVTKHKYSCRLALTGHVMDSIDALRAFISGVVIFDVENDLKTSVCLLLLWMVSSGSVEQSQH